MSIWRKVFCWLDMVVLEWKACFVVGFVFMWSTKKVMMEAIIFVVFWKIRLFQSDLVFGDKIPLRDEIFENIVDFLFNWFVFKNSKISAKWVDWLDNPFLVVSL